MRRFLVLAVLVAGCGGSRPAKRAPGEPLAPCDLRDYLKDKFRACASPDALVEYDAYQRAHAYGTLPESSCQEAAADLRERLASEPGCRR